MTPAILVAILSHGYKKITDFSLLVFDECHHVKGNDKNQGHPYTCIMHEYHKRKKEKAGAGETLPKIFGMTASVIKTNELTKEELFRKIQQLQSLLDGTIVRVEKNVMQLSQVVSKPTVINMFYILSKENTLSQLPVPAKFAKTNFEKWLNAINRLVYSMGYWAADKALVLLQKKVGKSKDEKLFLTTSRMALPQVVITDEKVPPVLSLSFSLSLA